MWSNITLRLRKFLNRKTRDPKQRISPMGFYNTKRSIFPKPIKALQRGTNKAFFQQSGSFHEAIGPILAMAQCFGIMPVIGIKKENASGLYFNWKSFRILYSLLITCGSMLYLMCQLKFSFQGDLKFDNIVPVIFFGSCLYTRVCFLFLANQWPVLMQQWQHVEKQLPQFGTLMQKSAMAYKMKMVTIIVMSLSLVEHMMSIISTVFYSHLCDPHQDDPIRNYFLAELEPLFQVVPFRAENAVFGKFVNVCTTFMWSYMDLFVMLVGIGLSSRFKQINDSLMRHKGKEMPEQFWIEHRQYYRSMCDLCKSVDDAISKITIVSFANNLYFVCVQLLRSLNRMPSFLHAAYFWFSLIFLIARTLAVSLYSAEINDESKRPLVVFRSVPKDSWCLEIKRFSNEVTNDVVALSGMQFFHITRKLVLSVAGTIVTYELVLIQFHEDDNENVVFCT